MARCIQFLLFTAVISFCKGQHNCTEDDAFCRLDIIINNQNKAFANLQGLETKIDDIKNKMTSLEKNVNATRTELAEHTADVQLECQEGWVRFEDSCYYFGETKVTWLTGRQMCLNMNADYVKISTDTEFKFVQDRLTDNTWVGLNDRNIEGSFVWVSDNTNETITDDWWYPGQPDNYLGNEHCVHYSIKRGNILWNDTTCDKYTCRILCEMVPT